MAYISHVELEISGDITTHPGAPEDSWPHRALPDASAGRARAEGGPRHTRWPEYVSGRSLRTGEHFGISCTDLIILPSGNST